MSALQLPERLTHLEASACLGELLARLPAGGAVSVDAAALRDFDSAALATLLALRRHLLLQGRALSLSRVPPRLSELVALYGVGELLPA